MTPEFQDKFLSQAHYGILTTLKKDGSPISEPVWFDWDGKAVRIFTGVKSAKIKRIRRDARVTFLVANHPDEEDACVAFDGLAEIHPGDAELLERISAKYWDMSDPERRATVDSWISDLSELCMIELAPTQIRSQ